MVTQECAHPGSLLDATHRGGAGTSCAGPSGVVRVSCVEPSWRTRCWMKLRVSQPQNLSPCPRASACSVLTGRRHPVATSCDPPTVERHAPRRRGYFARRAIRGHEGVVRGALVVDGMSDEIVRKPPSKPFSVSPCLPMLRVNRPEAHPDSVRCWTSRAETPRNQTFCPSLSPWEDGNCFRLTRRKRSWGGAEKEKKLDRIYKIDKIKSGRFPYPISQHPVNPVDPVKTTYTSHGALRFNKREAK